MRGKPGISKSIRFPEFVYEIVDSCEGDNFSDKLFGLIIAYRDDIPKRQKEIQKLEIQIQRRSEQLEVLGKRIDALDDVLREIFYMQPTYDRIRQSVQEIMAQLPPESGKLPAPSGG